MAQQQISCGLSFFQNAILTSENEVNKERPTLRPEVSNPIPEHKTERDMDCLDNTNCVATWTHE